MRPPLIVLLCASIFAMTVSQGAFPALLPEIGTANGLSDSQLGIAAGAFGFARLAADLPIGVFLTRHLRRAFVIAPLLLVAGVLCVGSGGPFALVVAGRIVMGVAHGLGVVAGLTAILRHPRAGGLASSLGAYELSAMLGILAGTGALRVLPGWLPWNAAFLLTCLPQLAGLAVLPALLKALPPEPAAAARPPLDGARPARGAGRLTAGAALAFTAGCVVATVYASLEHFGIPLRGSREFGLDRGGVAALLMVVQVFDILFLVPVGALGDRVGVSRVLGTLLLVFAAGATLVTHGDYRLMVAGCALFGIGMAGWTMPLALLRAETPAEQIGWRTALYRVGVDGGIFLGPVLAGLLAARAPALLPTAGAVALLVIGVLVLRRPVRAPRAAPVPAAGGS